LYFGHCAWLSPSEWQVKTLRAAASPPAAFIKPQGRRGPSLAADSPQQQNLLYVLWEIKALEEMLAILWS
jgi:hypothetical protein